MLLDSIPELQVSLAERCMGTGEMRDIVENETLDQTGAKQTASSLINHLRDSIIQKSIPSF